jgi:hypothetical protein
MTSDVDRRQQQRSNDVRCAGQAPVAGDLEGELRRFEPMPDGRVLAAVERAERHRRWEREGVPLSDIAHHLGFVHGSWTTRRLRPQLEALIAADLMSRARRYGVMVWVLTSAGRARAARLRRAGEVGELPESPQHRAWRHARAMAGERIEEFRARVRRSVDAAAGLLDIEATGSDAWFAAAEELNVTCRHLGSAVYCLREWQETDDARADIDDHCEPGDERLSPGERGRVRHLRTGRRTVWQWPYAETQG